MTVGLLPERAPSPTGPGTLGRQLVLRVAAIVAVTAMLLSAASFLAVREFLVRKADQQLTATAVRQGRDPLPPSRGQVQDARDQGLRLPGTPVGGIVAATDGTNSAGRILTEVGWVDLPSAVVSELTAKAKRTGLTTVRLTELGNYRASVATGSGGAAIVVAIPLADVDHVVRQMLVLELALALLAIGAAVVVTRLVVADTLRPLHEVASVAAEVSQLELDTGEVDLGLRVPTANAHPGNEVGRVGLALNHMLNNVEGALAARQASETKVRQFVADASHELRNPLAAIRGYAELTRRGREELPPDIQFAMSRIDSESERMSRLVDDLLLLARIDNGPSLSITDVDLAEVVLNAVSDARVAGPDHVWRLDLAGSSVGVLGDRYRLHQVISNLLSNARTHTPAGTIVTTGLRVADGSAIITVTDDGPGVPAEIAGKIFERFVRGDVARARKAGQSTGLGLSIVAAVVHAHRGTVRVASRPGHTEFTVTLPLAEA